MIETWNELHEGTGISATKEYGRRYINFTAQNTAHWKASTSSPPAMVWASLGPQVYESGLHTALNAGDGTWLTTRIAGHDAIYTDRFGVRPAITFTLP